MSAQESSCITISGRDIGPGRPVYIIAEVSANHGHRFEDAVALVKAAAAAGVDAVKLQTYTADTLTLDSDQEHFRVGTSTLWAGRMLYDLYREAYTPWEWHAELKRVAEACGVALFSTPFDRTAVDFLEELAMPAHKIASFELVDLDLVGYAASTGKPLIMSTGMASLEEIEQAVEAARSHGAREIALLKCTSAYPSQPSEMNLRTIPHLAEHFGCPVGLSDHTLGASVPVAAVSLGACLIEKHICLSRAVPGPDSAFSLEPAEFAALVRDVRQTEAALGGISYGPGERERASLAFRRSLFAVKDIRAGERFTRDNIRSIRPADGLPPRHLPDILGRAAARDLRRGTPLSWEHVGPQ
jgi:pseudaminic acid synthase